MDCSKEALKILNDKEKKVKDRFFEIADYYKLSNKECIRICAFVINTLKGIKNVKRYNKSKTK